MDDNDYDDRASTTYTDQTTSSYQSPVSDTKKELVRAAAPGGGRCLIENCAEDGGAIQFAHCIPRSLSWNQPQTMDNLEWWWNLPTESLNLDTRYNIFPLGSKLHALLDKPEWLLIPDVTVVDHYHAKCRLGSNGWETERDEFSPYPDPVCLYNLVPMPYKMKKTWISRQRFIPGPGLPLQHEHISTYLHPFTNLPQLESHLRPHFAIFEAGRKLAKLDAADTGSALADFPLLHKIAAIYSAWIKAPPSKAKPDVAQLVTVPRKKPQIKDDAETEPGRREPRRSHRRKASSPTPRGGKRQNLGNQQGGGENLADDGGKHKRARRHLSGETLRHYFDAGEKMWTSDNIRTWSEHNCISGDSF